MTTSPFEFQPHPNTLPKSTFVTASDRRRVSALDFFSAFDERDESGCADEVSAPLDPEQSSVPDESALQIAAMIRAAREDASDQVRREMQAEREIEQQRERARAEHLAVEFARDRQRYFAAAEEHVVRLALMIAERVLAREVTGTELPLAATVRAALARVQDNSETVLRVRPEQAQQWRALFADELRISVAEDGRLSVDDCILETRIGRVDLGLRTQLEEIERGFKDLIMRTGD